MDRVFPTPPARTGPAHASAVVLACALLGLPPPSFAVPQALPAPARSAATGAVAASAQAPGAAERPIRARHTRWLEQLTWMEIRDAIAAGTTTAIIPTGGIEANGPYLATGKHNVILEASCPVIAENLGNALCAPVVKFVPEGDIDPPTGAMRFPGTISLRAATYEALLEDIAGSLKQAGFSDIVMIGDSGGNQRGMAEVAARLNGRWRGTDTRAHFVREYYDPGWEATERYTERELGVAESRDDGFHDDIWVTAMMMVVDPALVRFEERVDAGLASINGVAITPLHHTVTLGRRMIAFRADLSAEAIRASIAAARDERPPSVPSPGPSAGTGAPRPHIHDPEAAGTAAGPEGGV